MKLPWRGTPGLARDQASPQTQRSEGVDIMDVNTLARLSGLNPDSVLDCKQFDRACLFKIDPKRDPAVLRRNDQFQTSFILDGQAQPFIPDEVEKKRSLQWSDPEEHVLLPAWGVRAYRNPPAYGAATEFIRFTTFERQQGEYDLSVDPENNPLARPHLGYGLTWQLADIVVVLKAFAHAGIIEVHHELQVPDATRLSAAFSGVKFLMPNCHEYFEQAPDREFEVELPSGFYELFGVW